MSLSFYALSLTESRSVTLTAAVLLTRIYMGCLPSTYLDGLSKLNNNCKRSQFNKTDASMNL